MRIGIDTSSTKDEFSKRAIGNYTSNLVREMRKIAPEHEYVLFDQYYPWRFLRSTAFDLFIAPKIRKANLDVFFQPNFNAGVPRWARTKVRYYPSVLAKFISRCGVFGNPKTPKPKRSFGSVVMMHDVIPLARNKFSQKGFIADKIKKYFYLRDLRCVEHADSVVTNSKFTKSDLVKYTDIAEEKITVTHLGIDEGFRIKNKVESSKGKGVSSKGKEDYVLYLGGVEENKNILKLLEAFSLLRIDSSSGSRITNTRLILAGGQFVNENKLETRRVLELVNELNLQQYVERPGYVPQEELPQLYAKAKVFVYPSLYEGFGLPPVEAMACGAPVVVSNTTSMPEICGSAAVYIDPRSVESIKQGIEKVLNLYGTDQYTALVEKGTDWAEQYSWEKCAKETLNVLEQFGS